jgi:putative DNA primase/helicase
MNDRGLVHELAAYISLYDSFARDRGGRLFWYQEGVYVPDGEFALRRLVKRVLLQFGKSDKWSRGLANEVIEYVLLDAPELPPTPSFDTINVQNGLLNIWSGELMPHSPHVLSSVRIPITYDQNALCPAVEAFIGEVFPPDSVELAWEILGDLLTPDRSIQKALCLVGEGGNGKGAFLQLAINFVGPANVSNMSLQRLESDRFAVANLTGKLANVCADLPSERPADAAVFKAITGCDRVTAEFKYGQPFEFTPFARLLFSANHLPVSRDGSSAYFDRWLVLPFERTFRATGREIARRILDNRLGREEELSGALSRALPALRRVRKEGSFALTKSVRAGSGDLRLAGDPLAAWLQAETVPDPLGSITQEHLYAAYVRACIAANRPAITRQMFGRLFRRCRPEVQEAQRTVGGKRQWVYLGVRMSADPAASMHSMHGFEKQNGVMHRPSEP